jgi:hypothetical protein
MLDNLRRLSGRESSCDFRGAMLNQLSAVGGKKVVKHLDPSLSVLSFVTKSGRI